MGFLRIALLLVALPSVLAAQRVNDVYLRYIDRYKDIAVEQMRQYGVPASITLAQGLLESDAGRSMLAVEGNNHFGIKCHSDWTGRTMYYDDDRRGECFRKYGSADASYRDHSVFLSSSSRYAFLFNLSQTDYKGWARGLKNAGYATNPQYADKLIGIIELYELYQYDRVSTSRKQTGHTNTSFEDEFSRQTFLSNGLLYVLLDDGETLKDVSREFRTTRAKLRRYNEIDRQYVPPAGSVIYLEKKKCRASWEYNTHVVGPDDSLWSISQLYGVRMNCLIRKNKLDDDNPLKVGMILRVR